MTARVSIAFDSLNLRVEESSPGLFFWIVTQLSSAQEQAAEVRVDASDHPYPSHEAAMHVGTACLKAYRSAADWLPMPPARPTAPF